MGLGAMRLVGHGRTHWDRSSSLRVLRDAVDLGVNHIDTAAFYFHEGRRANELIRQALHPYPKDLVIATRRREVVSAFTLVGSRATDRQVGSPGRTGLVLDVLAHRCQWGAANGPGEV